MASPLAPPGYLPPLLAARACRGDAALLVRPHHWQGRLLLEIEPDAETRPDPDWSNLGLASLQQRLQALLDPVQVSQETVAAMRQLAASPGPWSCASNPMRMPW